MPSKILCGYCNEIQDIDLKVIIDWVDEDFVRGDTACGRVKMRCRHCGREIVNMRFEE
jgi:hypothetical protein